MGSIAMTRMTMGITKEIAIPLTQVAFDDIYSSNGGMGLVLEGNGKDCAVRIGLSDAEGRILALHLNAHYARAGLALREKAEREAAAEAAATVPPGSTGDVA